MFTLSKTEKKNPYTTNTHSKMKLRAAQPKEPHKNSKTFCGDPGLAQAV